MLDQNETITEAANTFLAGDFIQVTKVRDTDRNYYRIGATGVIQKIDSHEETPDALVKFNSGLLSHGPDGQWWVPLDNLEKMG